MDSRKASIDKEARKRSSGTSEEIKKVNFLLEEPHNQEKRESLKDIGNSIKEDVTPGTSPKTQRKIISTWRMACDKTKDRTKDLLKRWRTLPEGSMKTTPAEDPSMIENEESSGSGQQDGGWSVHVWATWVKRYPSDDDTLSDAEKISTLSPVQKDKLGHFFSHVLDMDRDDMISLQDFEGFTEKIRHFAEWSDNSAEYLTLQQVQDGFVNTFILPIRPEGTNIDIDRLFLSIDDWMCMWNTLITDKQRFRDLPVWLQYFSKILFVAINKEATGVISKEELGSFFSSVMGFSSYQVKNMIDVIYSALTSNEEYKLTYSVYKLCFANFIFGRFPNGPGQHIFGYLPKSPDFFPIDYSAMNSSPEDREKYVPGKKSNRTSIIV